MTEATRPDPQDQPAVLAIDEVQYLWSQQVRLRPDAPLDVLLAGIPRCGKSSAALLVDLVAANEGTGKGHR